MYFTSKNYSLQLYKIPSKQHDVFGYEYKYNGSGYMYDVVIGLRCYYGFRLLFNVPRFLKELYER